MSGERDEVGAATTTYAGAAKRRDGAWELDIEGIGVYQYVGDRVSSGRV